MLTSFVAKAKATSKKYWKWVLGVLIGLIIAYVAWKLRRQANQIDALRADKLLFHMRAKDLKMCAENERDEAAAQALRERADAYEAAAADKETKIQAAVRNSVTAKESVADARNWQELEKQARGK